MSFLRNPNRPHQTVNGLGIVFVEGIFVLQVFVQADVFQLGQRTGMFPVTRRHCQRPPSCQSANIDVLAHAGGTAQFGPNWVKGELQWEIVLIKWAVLVAIGRASDKANIFGRLGNGVSFANCTGAGDHN